MTADMRKIVDGFVDVVLVNPATDDDADEYVRQRDNLVRLLEAGQRCRTYLAVECGVMRQADTNEYDAALKACEEARDA